MSSVPSASPTLDWTPNGSLQNDGSGTPGSAGRNGRHARKLQLRNAGFRGTAVPTRIVTPKSPDSTSGSITGELEALSGAENVPPGGKDARSTPSGGKRLSSGILLDIGNATVTRRKKARPRMSAGFISDSDGGVEGEICSSAARTPGHVKRTVKSGTSKAKGRLSQKRRSTSGETARYIEHLETELASAQSQLSRINSPTTMRNHATHIRNIDAEREILQKEIDDWEAKYEQRVQEEVDRHLEIETSLRTRIRALENECEEGRIRVQELQVQMESTTQSMNAVEAANVNLERRIEIMSELLAASPSKIDLHAETPGRGRKHVRPKSMLPRFPTASSLLGSPERQPQTQPTSPLMSFANYSPQIPSSPVQSVCRLDVTSQPSDYMSEAESVFSEASAAGDSMTSADTFDPQASFNLWSLPPAPPASRLKPVRRMRRFGAGSLGPKPLILPSTAHCDTLPLVSASVLERRETGASFLPDKSSSSDQSDRPLLGRRRASTMANGEDLAAQTNLSFLVEEHRVQEDENLIHLNATSSSPASRPVTRDMSSFGSVRGQNLMDELTAVSTGDFGLSSDSAFEHLGDSGLDAADTIGGAQQNVSEGTTLVQETAALRHPSGVVGLEVESPTSGTRFHSPHETRCWSSSYLLCCSPSLVERLRFLFGDIWNSPVDLARHLIQTAQLTMRVPRTVSNFQLWLVGFLLGPMAQRRRLTAHNPTSSARISNEETLLLDDAPVCAAEADLLAYGILHETPPSSSTKSHRDTHRRCTKRSAHRAGCPHRRSKHSPFVWLKFSIALAFAVGTALKDGPATLLGATVCSCQLADYVSRAHADGQAVERLR